MATFQLISSFNLTSLIFSALELTELYLHGIPLVDKQGNPISQDTLEFYIEASQLEVEKYFELKFQPQIIEEDIDFNLDDWKQWGYLKCTFFVRKAYQLKGFVNTVQQMEIPQVWLSTKHSSDPMGYYRQIHTVPIAATGINYSVIYNGVVPLGFFMNSSIPNYWKAIYVTGYRQLPSDLMNFVGKLAAINTFHMLGDLILGTPGIISKSIGIDGLSQSYNTQGGFSQRINGYMKDLEILTQRIYNSYKGFTCLAC